MALTFDNDDLWLLRKCILAALELLRAHRASEDLFDLDGFVEYGGKDVNNRVHELRVRVEKHLGVL